MGDVIIADMGTVIFIVLGYAAICCIALWQYQLRDHFQFPRNLESLTALHTMLSIGLLLS